MALAHVQTVGARNSLVTSVTTSSITTTSGNLLIAVLAWFKPSSIFSSLTDSKSNTWELVHEDSTLDAPIRVMYAKNCTGGSGHTFTLTLTGTGYPTIAVVEVSGAHLTAPLDQQSTDADTLVTTLSSGNISTTQADEILVGAGTSPQNTTYTVDGDYTQRYNQDTTTAFQGLIVGTRIVSSTETNDYVANRVDTGTLTSSVSSFKASAGGASNTDRAPGAGALVVTGQPAHIPISIQPTVGALAIAGIAGGPAGNVVITIPSLVG